MKMWQIMIDENEKITFLNDKPFLKKNGVWANEDNDSISCFLFPVKLKPLQIAEIKVNENGTWSYEIEPEEGWYMAKWSDKIDTAPDRKNIFIEYKCGKYLFPSGKEISLSDFAELTISTTRIPDECII